VPRSAPISTAPTTRFAPSTPSSLAPHAGPKVVAFSGGGAPSPASISSAYGVAKTGVVRLIETIAEELRDQPIDLIRSRPGPINTRLTDKVLALGPTLAGSAEYAAAVKQKPRVVRPREALGLVTWLLRRPPTGWSAAACLQRRGTLGPRWTVTLRRWPSQMSQHLASDRARGTQPQFRRLTQFDRRFVASESKRFHPETPIGS